MMNVLKWKCPLDCNYTICVLWLNYVTGAASMTPTPSNEYLLSFHTQILINTENNLHRMIKVQESFQVKAAKANVFIA